MFIRPFAALAFAGLACAALPAAAVTLGQADTFEDGSTQGWTVAVQGMSHPAPPANTGGSGVGPGDRFLMLTSIGGTTGAGSRLSVLNTHHWGGNYLTSGVGAIRMDVANFGSSDLSLRLMVEFQMFNLPLATAFSKTPIVLPAGGDWTRVTFSVAASDLMAGQGTVTEALTSATGIRIFHGASAKFPPDPVVGRLGIDNVTAVPEPATAALWGLGLLALGGLARRRR